MNSREQSQKPAIRIGVVDSDPLRLVGFRALLESETDFEFIYASISDLDPHGRIDIILLGNQRGQASSAAVVKLRPFYPDAQTIAIGAVPHDETLLPALSCGAKGYVDE